MSVFLSPVGGAGAQFFDNSGNVLTGGKLYTYAAGTTTPQATYTSSAGSTFHANPIVLDAAGRVPSGGEIWLADSQIYKFVLKDSNDVLLATWDQLTGVNSNFVNYTAKTELQTATSGQTVFTLTTMSYQPATGSLTVYVDGVNQYEGESYFETDSTTVTFVSGLHVGAEVKFTTAVQTTGNATDASAVSYTAPYTGAVAYTVEDKLAQTVSVMDFGAVGDGVTDDTAAIQAAIDTGKDVIFTEASYRITSPLQVGSQRLTGGVGSKWTNRPQSRIIVQGNHAAFINKSGFPSFQIDGFYIYFGGTTPTDSATQGNKIGFYFTTTGGGWPEIVQINNCTVRGSWWTYFDDTGTYLSKLTQVIGRNSRRGFRKSGGTTILFDTCATADGVTGFYLDNILSPTLINCACDLLDVSTSGSFAASGNLFVSCQSLVINGWDAESNAINTNGGGSDAALFRFQDTVGTISGFFGFLNTFETSGAGAGAGVNLFKAENNSRLTILGSQDVFTGAIPYTGTGGFPATLQTDSTSWISVHGSQFSAATGGFPVISTVATGSNITFTNSQVTGTNTGYSETKTSAGLQIPNIYTQRGDTAVSAGVATNIVTLSNSTQAVWMLNIWNPNAGTTYMTSALVNFDGTNWVITNLKAGADLVLNISGTIVQATSTAATTLRWSIVRVA